MGTVNSVLKDEKPFLIEKYKYFTTNYQNIYSYIVSKGVMKNLKELFLLEEMFPVAWIYKQFSFPLRNHNTSCKKQLSVFCNQLLMKVSLWMEILIGLTHNSEKKIHEKIPFIQLERGELALLWGGKIKSKEKEDFQLNWHTLQIGVLSPLLTSRSSWQFNFQYNMFFSLLANL